MPRSEFAASSADVLVNKLAHSRAAGEFRSCMSLLFEQVLPHLRCACKSGYASSGILQSNGWE